MTKSGDDYEDYRNDNDPGGERDEGRTLRGGSFDDGVLIVRCATRNGASSDGRFNCFGFRIVVAPF